MYLLFLFLHFFTSERENTQTLNNADPQDFQIHVTIHDHSGLVTTTSTALNTEYFEFNPGDGSKVLTDSVGLFSHTYPSNGTYTLIIKAYGSSGKFLEKGKEINIQDIDTQIPQYEGFSLVWQEEFDDTSLRDKFWNYKFGTGDNDDGWGNNELQYYRRENAEVTGGNLIITAKKENFADRAYTSSRLTTEGKYSFQYGRVDVSAKLPEGQGIWPAIWMLGSNFSCVGWPACGEIDIMEMKGGNGREKTIHGTYHWQDPEGNPDFRNHKYIGGKITSPTSFSEDFHKYSIIWNENEITWLVDNEPYATQDITDPNRSEFREPFFFLINLAVGGNWPGNPDERTTFPQKMMVDYIRVYQKD